MKQKIEKAIKEQLETYRQEALRDIKGMCEQSHVSLIDASDIILEYYNSDKIVETIEDLRDIFRLSKTQLKCTAFAQSDPANILLIESI